MHHNLSPTLKTVHWGHFDAALKPVLTIGPGDTLTVSSFTGTKDQLPANAAMDVFEEHRTIASTLTPSMGPHLLTGPVAIEGAEPGDVLEVRIDAVRLIQNWGYTLTKPFKGALPHRFNEDRIAHILIDRTTKTALCPWGTELPLAPFFGVMGVAPRPEWGRLSSVEPREFGGNIDCKEFVAGTTLYLPIFAHGALFSVGDGHGCQGDGEVNVTALETSLEGTFTFALHKKPPKPRVRATTPEHIITLGFDPDLDDAAAAALDDMVDLLVACAGMKAWDAYALCSLACDLRVTQLVDGNKGVHAMMKRSLLPPIDDAIIGCGGSPA